MEQHQTLEQNKDLREIISQLLDGGHDGQADSLMALMDYMTAMEQQYTAVTRELSEMRQQLETMENKELKSLVSKAIEAIQEKLYDVRARLDAVHDKIASWAKDTVTAIRDTGVLAADSVASTLHIKDALESVNNGLQGAIKQTNAALDRAETMSFELNAAAKHVRNAGYAAIGKAPPSHLAGNDTIHAVFTKPLEMMHGLLVSMDNKTLAAIGATKHLKETAPPVRGARRIARSHKQSIRRMLTQKSGTESR